MQLQDLSVLLNEVRSRWLDSWPGMQLYVDQCLAIQGHSVALESSRGIDAIYRCMCDVAKLIEGHGQALAVQGREPAYHNRLHTIDTLFALTALLIGQRQRGVVKTAEWRRREWVATLAMLGHDLLHDGTINVSPGQIERRSFVELSLLMEKHHVDFSDQALIEKLIVNTDPTKVRECHQNIHGRPFRIEDDDCLIVLLQEADIMASVLPWTGKALTLQLASEWAKIAPNRARALLTSEGRLTFLKNFALFTSPVSESLGLNKIRLQEIAEIECNKAFE